MDFSGKNILISGINGFLGTAAAKRFLEQGAHVVGIIKDHNRKTNDALLKKCSIVEGDIEDFGTVSYAMSHYEIEYVLHLASQAIVKICHSDPYRAYMTNIVGVLNILEAARTQSIPPKKLIVQTSDKFYGSAATLPYVEDLPPGVADTYCTSKTCQDMVSRSYAITYGVPALVVRAGNIYGPGDLNMSRVIPKSIVNLLAGKSPVLYSHAAKMVREFIYIEDMLDAFEILFDRGVVGEAYNVGGSIPVKIGHVIEILCELLDPNLSAIIEEVSFGEINEQYLNADKLKALGWFPKWTLEEGLLHTINFYKGQ